MTTEIEFEFHEATLALSALSRAQHSQDSSLYSRNMSEFGIRAISLRSEPIVKFRKFVKLLRMHDKSPHRYIHTYTYSYSPSNILLTEFGCYWLLRTSI